MCTDDGRGKAAGDHDDQARERVVDNHDLRGRPEPGIHEGRGAAERPRGRRSLRENQRARHRSVEKAKRTSALNLLA